MFKILFLLLCYPLTIYAAKFDAMCGENFAEYGQCNEKIEYWWQDKLPEVNEKVDKLVADITFAALNNDYSKIDQYLKFPIKFYVSIGGSKDKSKTWVAKNKKDFIKYFNKIFEYDDYIKKKMQNNEYKKVYYAIGQVGIFWYSRLYISMDCKDYLLRKETEYIRLPQRLSYCNHITPRIYSMKVLDTR